MNEQAWAQTSAQPSALMLTESYSLHAGAPVTQRYAADPLCIG
jgi:hypothetical protein